MIARAWGRVHSFYAENKQLTALSLIFLMIFLGIGAILPIRTVVAREQGATLAEIGWMGSSFLIASFAFQLPFGWLSDKLGRKPLIIAGAITHVILCLLYPFAPNTIWFIALRALEGVSTAAAMPAARAYITDIVLPARRGEAFGVFSAALSGGILLGPAIGGFLGDKSVAAPFIFSAICGVIALILAIVVIHEPRHAEKAVAKAESSDKNASAPFRWRALLGIYFVAAFFMSFARQFVESLFGSLWNVALLDHGWSLDMIGLTYSMFGIPTLLLMVYGGQVADRTRYRGWLYMGCGLIISLIYVGYGWTLSLFVPLLLLDMVEASLASFAWPIADRYVAMISPENGRGRVQALYGVIGTLGGVIGTYLSTTLYEVNQYVPFIMFGIVQVLNATVAGGVMLRYERHHGTPKREQVDELPNLVPVALE